MAYSIHKEIMIDAPAERVWDAITDKTKLTRWYMSTENFEPTVGTKFEFQDKPQGKWDGKILGEVTTVDAPRLLEYTFWGNQMKYTTKVRWTLVQQGNRTKVVVDHTGFEGFGGGLMKLIIQFGWNKFLKQLADIC